MRQPIVVGGHHITVGTHHSGSISQWEHVAVGAWSREGHAPHGQKAKRKQGGDKDLTVLFKGMLSMT